MADNVTGIAGLARRLYRARKLLSADRPKPVTQREIAEAVGVSEGQVGHWEKGRQKPDLDTIERLAVALQVRPEWIAYGIGPGPGADAVLRFAGLEVDLATLRREPDAELRRAIVALEREEAERAAPAQAANDAGRPRRK